MTNVKRTIAILALACSWLAGTVAAQSIPMSALETAYNTALRGVPAENDQIVLRFDFWEQIGGEQLAPEQAPTNLFVLQRDWLAQAAKASGIAMGETTRLRTEAMYNSPWEFRGRSSKTAVSHVDSEQYAQSAALSLLLSTMEERLTSGAVTQKDTFQKSLDNLREQHEYVLWKINEGHPNAKTAELCRIVLARMAKERFDTTINFEGVAECRVQNHRLSFRKLRTDYYQQSVRIVTFKGSNVFWLVGVENGGAVYY